jgi:hypothetical protein
MKIRSMNKKNYSILLLIVIFIFLSIFTTWMDGDHNAAIALTGNYSKQAGQELSSQEWNNLKSDFVAKSGDTMTGNLALNNSLCFGADCRNSWASIITPPNGTVGFWTGANTGNINSTNAGNVGIGNANPAFKLDATGQINAAGGLCINGDCKTAWSQITTAQYWTASGANISNNNTGNVGIGTNNPANGKLEVVGGDFVVQDGNHAGEPEDKAHANLILKGSAGNDGTATPGYPYVQSGGVAYSFQLYKDDTFSTSNMLGSSYYMTYVHSDGGAGQLWTEFSSVAAPQGGGTLGWGNASHQIYRVGKNPASSVTFATGAGVTAPTQIQIMMSLAPRILDASSGAAVGDLYLTGDMFVGGQNFIRRDGANAHMFAWGTGYPSNTLYIGALVGTNLWVSGTVTPGSDRRLKNNIKKLDNSLENILKLDGVSFNWKDSGDKSMGLIAQDVEKIYPELIKENPNGIKGLNYEALTAPLIESVKELNGKINEKDERISDLEKQIKAINKRLEELEKR